MLELFALEGTPPGVAGLVIVKLMELEVTATRQKEAMETETAVLAVVALRIWPARMKAQSAPIRTALRALERDEYVILVLRLNNGFTIILELSFPRKRESRRRSHVGGNPGLFKPDSGSSPE